MLWFTPAAWIQLNWLAHAGNVEIGGFGLTLDPRQLLISEFHLIEQTCSSVTVAFEDAAVADYFEQMVDAGHKPEQFARVWLHSHPGDCPLPSHTDELTFQRVFGSCDWAIMFIVAKGGATYARLRFGVGPGCQVLIPVGVRWDLPVGLLDEDAWADDYAEKVNDIDELAGTWPAWWDEHAPPGKGHTDSRDVHELDALDDALWQQHAMEESSQGTREVMHERYD
jgi:hypothetical protein